MAGARSSEIMSFGNRDDNTCLHLACASPLCSRELIVFIKEIEITYFVHLDIVFRNFLIDAISLVLARFSEYTKPAALPILWLKLWLKSLTVCTSP